MKSSEQKSLHFFVEISKKFVPNGPMEDMPALVQGVAWHLNQCWPRCLTSYGIIGTLWDTHAICNVRVCVPNCKQTHVGNIVYILSYQTCTDTSSKITFYFQIVLIQRVNTVDKTWELMQSLQVLIIVFQSVVDISEFTKTGDWCFEPYSYLIGVITCKQRWNLFNLNVIQASIYYLKYLRTKL